MTSISHPDAARIDAVRIDEALAIVGRSPSRAGTVDMIVCRPGIEEREVLAEAELVVGRGVVGDNYFERGSEQTDDGLAHPEAQLNIMNSRVIDTIAGGDRSRWQMAGDQFFVDLDLSVGNLPVGTRLAVGTAIIEVAAKPHTGCAKFSQRFGVEAARWVNQSKDERRRGLCATVVQPGVVVTGDEIRVVE